MTDSEVAALEGDAARDVDECLAVLVDLEGQRPGGLEEVAAEGEIDRARPDRPESDGRSGGGIPRRAVVLQDDVGAVGDRGHLVVPPPVSARCSPTLIPAVSATLTVTVLPAAGCVNVAVMAVLGPVGIESLPPESIVKSTAGAGFGWVGLTGSGRSPR